MSIDEDVQNRNTSSHTRALRDALEAAHRGFAVFPLIGKAPAIPTRHGGRGYKDATCDRSRVIALFTRAIEVGRYPTGYGIATGAASDAVVVDVDGPEARAEAERRALQSERVVKTGRPDGDGYHVYLVPPPEVTLRSRDLAPGLELKAEGAYVVGPGSDHPSGQPYRALKDGDPSPAPAWILENAGTDAEPSCAAQQAGDRGPVAVDVAGPPIPDGERNRTLTRIAGRLHDGSRDLGRLTDDLATVNAARCTPPLTAGEVAKIAASIHRRAACKPYAPKASAEVLMTLDGIEATFWARPWPGMGGRGERDVLVALIKEARKHGVQTPAGVRVIMSVRALALAAAVSKAALTRKGGTIHRLKAAGWLRRDDADRSGTNAGAFVLVAPRAPLTHSTHRGGVLPPENASGSTLRAPFTTPRLRWTKVMRERFGDEWETTVIRRLGKTAGAVLDALERAGGEATVEELADALEVRRPRDLRRRAVARLEAASVVECTDDTVKLVAEWLDAVNREREATEEIADQQRDMKRYAREREDYRSGRKASVARTKPDRAPTEREMRERREAAPKRRRCAIEAAIARLFAARPEYRGRRVGQVTCALIDYLGPNFPRGLDGVPKDAEVEAVMEGIAA